MQGMGGCNYLINYVSYECDFFFFAGDAIRQQLHTLFFNSYFEVLFSVRLPISNNILLFLTVVSEAS